MVHALHRAHALVAPDGCVVDLRPTPQTAHVGCGGLVIGALDADAADRRHAAAESALAAVLSSGLFRADGQQDFWFLTHGDSIEELRDHVHRTWRDSRVGDALVARARDVRRVNPSIELSIAEQLRITRLLPR